MTHDRDDRPATYPGYLDTSDTDPVRIYRASSVGGCEQALRYARAGKPRSPASQRLNDAMETSAALEQPVIDAFTEQYQIKVTDQQKRGVIEVSTGLWIAGSVDGIGHPEDLGGEGNRGLVEVKVFGESFYNEWFAKRFAAFPTYEAQFHVYCAMHDLAGGWMVVAQKDENGFLVTRHGKVHLDVTWHPYKTAVVARAKATVRSVERWYPKFRAREVGWTDGTDCTMAWGCPYWQLHPDDTEVTIDGKIAAWLSQRDEAMSMEKRAKAAKDKLGIQVATDLFGVNGEGSYVVKATERDPGWKVTTVGGDSVRTDFDQMRKDGIEVEKYQTKTPKKRSVRITKQGSTTDEPT